MTQKKLPYMPFYIGDWKKEAGVQTLSFHDRHVWFEMLMLMHDSDERGYLVLNGKPMTSQQVSRLIGLSAEEFEVSLRIIESNGLYSVRESDGAIYSRSMVRRESLSVTRSTSGSKGGSAKFKENYNSHGFVYLMRRSSDGLIKIGISKNPVNRLYRVRHELKQDVCLLGTMKVEDMGKEEKSIHSRYSHCQKGEWFNLTALELSSLQSSFSKNLANADNDIDNEYDIDHVSDIKLKEVVAAAEPEDPPPDPENLAASLLAHPDDPKIQNSPHFINAGRRPMRKYPELWLSEQELNDALETIQTSGVSEDSLHLVFKPVAARARSHVAEGRAAERVNAFGWLTGWGLNQALDNLKKATDLERSKIYADNARMPRK